MTAIITCSIENKTFESHFPIDRETPEYDFGEFLKNLDYDYKIKEEAS